MHAKSLNALVSTLEFVPTPARIERSDPKTGLDEVAAKEAFSRIFANLAEVQKSIRGSGMSLDNSASEGQVATQEQSVTPPAAPNLFDWCDGSLGLRQRVESRAGIRKSETSIRLFSGFISRDDLAQR